MFFSAIGLTARNVSVSQASSFVLQMSRSLSMVYQKKVERLSMVLTPFGRDEEKMNGSRRVRSDLAPLFVRSMEGPVFEAERWLSTSVGCGSRGGTVKRPTDPDRNRLGSSLVSSPPPPTLGSCPPPTARLKTK